jgi:hypothetical protein
MITLIFGVPGSGKTYWMTHIIRKKVLRESDIFFKVKEDCLLITNLTLKLDDTENYIYIEDWEQWMQFLNVDFWQRNLAWWQGKKVWLIMDEAQRFFALAKENPNIWFYLQYHRHFGTHNLIFATQTPKSIPGKLYELAEYVIEAVPKSLNIFFAGFRYRVLSPLDKSIVLRRFHLPYNQITFYLYQDMVFKEDEEMRPQNAFIKPLSILVLMLLGVFISLHVFFSGFSPKKTQAQTKAQTQTIQSTQATQAQTQTISYEDLITEEPKQEPQKAPGQEPKQEPKKEEPGYFFLSLQKTTRPKETESLDFTPKEPKIIYLP